MTAFTLASGSKIRATLLQNAGLAFSIKPAQVDEDAIKDDCLLRGLNPKAIALKLSEAKALDISRSTSGLVIGADSVLEFEKELISKQSSLTDARAQLARFSGKSHYLHSAVTITEGQTVIFSHCASAELWVRRLNDTDLDTYIERSGETILSSVGAYQLESLGITLFDKIDGDYFTILGLPLLPLLAQLRKLGAG